MRRQGSQVSMRVARGSASWLSSHGRGLGPRDALIFRQRERPGLPSQALAWPHRLSAGRRESASRGEAKDSALLSSRDAGLLEPPERPARGAGTRIPSAQRLVWAAKQALGNAALGALFVTLYRRQVSRPSPWKRNAKNQNGCLGRPYKYGMRQWTADPVGCNERKGPIEG